LLFFLRCDGQNALTIQKKVPDTITSWYITAFSLHPTRGLGLTKQPTIVTVFKPFFISTNVPYSVKLGEIMEVNVFLFNYLENGQNLDVTVEMESQNGEYDFVDADSQRRG
jgi:CD109 antigen